MISVDFAFLTIVFVGFRFCLRWFYVVSFAYLKIRWRRRRDLVLTLANRYLFKTDTVEHAIFPKCDGFWLDFHYVAWAGFFLL